MTKKFFCYDTDRKDNLDEIKTMTDVKIEDVNGVSFGPVEPSKPLLTFTIDGEGSYIAPTPYDNDPVILPFRNLVEANPMVTAVINGEIVDMKAWTDYSMWYLNSVDTNFSITNSMRGTTSNKLFAYEYPNSTIEIYKYQEAPGYIKPIPEEYFPENILKKGCIPHVNNASGETVTQDEFNILLEALRTAGILLQVE